MSISASIASASVTELPTEIKLRKFYEEEEGDMIVMDFCEDLIKNVMDKITANSLTDRAQNFVVNCAMEALKKSVDVYHCFHNVSFADMGEESWKPDVPCDPSPPDSWAAYRAPVSFASKPDPHGKVKENEVESSEEPIDEQDISLSDEDAISNTSSFENVPSPDDISEEISTSSSEGDFLPWLNTIPIDQQNEKLSARLSAKLSARLSTRSQRTNDEEEETEIPEGAETPEQNKVTTSTFSKIAVGETTKSLCVPFIGSPPPDNAVAETPEIEEYNIVRITSRHSKITKKVSLHYPRRRSDTKIKMTPIEEDNPEEKKKGKKK